LRRGRCVWDLAKGGVGSIGKNYLIGEIDVGIFNLNYRVEGSETQFVSPTDFLARRGI
jgi:hypothetical protein